MNRVLKTTNSVLLHLTRNITCSLNSMLLNSGNYKSGKPSDNDDDDDDDNCVTKQVSFIFMHFLKLIIMKIIAVINVSTEKKVMISVKTVKADNNQHK